jgi:hypothetical protein
MSNDEGVRAVIMHTLIKAMMRDMREIADNPLIDYNVVIRRLTSERMEPEDMTLRQMVDRYEFLLMAIGIEVGE